ncbi:HD domain-containing protein [Fomitiporia mediterranea MF3/22]|uniref:HD domain-containing protein n=1 Tax=Fomitiporia mediterranea (strain MF3/22) TaxID=694068 RepID=UPI00044079F6|nr:HD domain-containing protein [Fomitiporia mediterranea MF3/22]EJD07455.1 HD domain-containing protein [Fomitiporia mediterranea MF3/22]
MDPTPSTSKRVFPPLYKSSQDSCEDRLVFFHLLERLKTQKRTGWVDHGLMHSISDHMYRMAILAMCSGDTTLDNTKCILMCLVHDLAEAQVGDIAPREGIPKEEKKRLEDEAMHNFVHVMLHSTPAALRIEALWKEYEEGETAEARFVKDLDRFEMASQALEYERRHESQQLDVFFESSIPKLRHSEVQQWGADLMAERAKLHEERPRSSGSSNRTG